MRITHLFAALLAVAGMSAVTPASASTTLTKAAPVATPLAVPSGAGASADQYRDRGYRGGYGRGYRGGYGRGYRGGYGRGYGYRGGYGDRGWHRGYYRPRYYGYGYGWRGGRPFCRTSWRWGRPHRVCYRRW